jgi:hypothetical protein
VLTEERKDYDRLATAVIETVDPADTIEWLLTNDIIHNSFEIRRLRRIKVGLVMRCAGSIATSAERSPSAIVRSKQSMRREAQPLEL